MPPTTVTIPPAVEEQIEEQIEDVIERLEEFGDDFAQVIEDLRAILDIF